MFLSASFFVFPSRVSFCPFFPTPGTSSRCVAMSPARASRLGWTLVLQEWTHYIRDKVLLMIDLRLVASGIFSYSISSATHERERMSTLVGHPCKASTPRPRLDKDPALAAGMVHRLWLHQGNFQTGTQFFFKLGRVVQVYGHDATSLIICRKGGGART